MFRRTDNPDRVATRQVTDPSSLAARYARMDMQKYSFGESQTPGTDWSQKSGTADQQTVQNTAEGENSRN
jgi:hypothetical protein